MNRTLRIKGLSAAEVGLVKTILRLSSNLRAKWTVKDDGSCDAEFRDSALPMDEAMGGGALESHVVQVAQRGERLAGRAIERPLRAERLIEVLNAIPDPVQPAARTATPVAGPVRLRAWPPARVLGASAHRTRLATLMLHRTLTVEQLASISGRPLTECQALFADLAERDLLETEVALQPPLPRVAVHVAPPGTAVRSGWITRLRRKLGLSAGTP